MHVPQSRRVGAASLVIDRDPLPAEQTLHGSPSAGSVALGTLREVEYGVWEITPGISTHVETEEVFIVLSGHATIHFDDCTGPIEVRAGDVVRLTAGQHTIWDVMETLRKVYISR